MNIKTKKFIPQTLKQLNNWCWWNLEEKGGKLGKIPKQCKKPYIFKNGNASSTNNKTWCDYEYAQQNFSKSGYKGVGFILPLEANITFIDLDHCIENGEINDFAKDVIKMFPDTYIEISQSGTGIHILCYGTVKQAMKKGEKIEIYSTGRFCAMTGNALQPFELTNHQKEIDELYEIHRTKEIKKEAVQPITQNIAYTQTADEVIELIQKSANASKFNNLFYNGNIGDMSENTQALLCLIYFYTQDRKIMEEIIRRSPALNREKLDTRRGNTTWIGWEIDKAIEFCRNGNIYDPSYNTHSFNKTQSPASIIEKKKSIDYSKKTVAEYINNVFLEDIKELSKYGKKKTGFTQLDYALGGVLPQLYVLGAISSLGKTTLLHQIADQMAEAGESVIYFSLEQSQFELVSKSIGRQIYLNNNCRNFTPVLQIMREETPTKETIEAVKKYEEYAKNIIIYEGNFDTTVKTIREYIEDFIRQTNKKPIVFIDYLQIIKSLDYKMSDKQQIDVNVTELKRISKDFKIPVFVISSFNRANYREKVDYEAFSGSGGIEYSADVVLGLQLSVMDDTTLKDTELKEKVQKAKSEFPRRITLVGLKNRNNEPYFKIQYKFNAPANYFEEVKPF